MTRRIVIMVLLASALVPVRMTGQTTQVSAQAPAKPKCHTVTKKVHGKKKKVTVCASTKPKPTPTPAPTSPPAMGVTTDLHCPASFAVLQSAVAGSGPGGTITLECSSPTTVLFSANITITRDLTLDASHSPAPITFDGGGSQRLFYVRSGTFRVNGLTFAHSKEIQCCGGGGIWNDATLDVANSTFRENDSAILNNSSTATATIVNTTFVDNTNEGNGGGGVYNWRGTVSIADSTFVSNPADGLGLAIVQDAGTTTVQNDIFFYPGPSFVNGNCNTLGTIVDKGYNLDTDGSCLRGGPGDIIGKDPQLNALASNGGPTLTMPLKATSPAIDQAPTASCPAVDQTGRPRPDAGETTCDIGAVEYVDTP